MRLASDFGKSRTEPFSLLTFPQPEVRKAAGCQQPWDPCANTACLPWENPSFSLPLQMWNQLQTRAHEVIFVRNTLTQEAKSYWNEVSEGIKKLGRVRNKHYWMWELSMKHVNGNTANQVNQAQKKKKKVRDGYCSIDVLTYTLIPLKLQWGKQFVNRYATENETFQQKQT